MGGINNKKSEDLKVLSMKIQCDVSWCSCYLYNIVHPKVYFETSRLRTWEGKVVMYNKDDRVSNSIDSLEHRWHRFCSSELSVLILENHVFLRNTCLSRQGHPYMIEWPQEAYVQTTTETIPTKENTSLVTSFHHIPGKNSKSKIKMPWKVSKIFLNCKSSPS